MSLELYSRIVQDHVDRYPFAERYDLTTALSAMPYKQIEDQINQLYVTGQIESSIDRRDLFLIKILQYFKEELFTWVNRLECDRCQTQCNLTGIVSPNDEERKWRASNVELNHCPKCGSMYRFPRYNHPVKLMQTRRGRCGEWAIGFAFICISQNYDARLVYDCADHVWVEVFSVSQRRWIHTDPCENAFDQPLLYSCGWKKDLKIVIACGENEVRDVTWRYVPEWKQTLQARRQLFSERLWIVRLNLINQTLRRRRNLSLQAIQKIDDRWLGELAEMIRLPHQDRIEAKGNELVGRLSGDILWRLARCEVGDDKEAGKTFQMDELMKDDFTNCRIAYSCRDDAYQVIFANKCDNNKTMPIWRSMAFKAENVFRNVEHDWKMCYIARNKSSKATDVGRIVWNVTMSRKMIEKLDSIRFKLSGQTYEDGQVELQALVGDNKINFELNREVKMLGHELLTFSQASASIELKIEAKLKNGRGDIAWQHAQLFRQSSTINQQEAPFYVDFSFKN